MQAAVAGATLRVLATRALARRSLLRRALTKAFCMSCTSKPSTGPVSGDSGSGNMLGGSAAVKGSTSAASIVRTARNLVAGEAALA